jgi:hypothetical protein
LCSTTVNRETLVAGSSEEDELAAIGLVRGEEVRFRRSDRARWQLGVVTCLERDGSLRVADRDGAARTVPLARVEVRRSRTEQWEPVSHRTGRGLQLQFELKERARRR